MYMIMAFDDENSELPLEETKQPPLIFIYQMAYVKFGN